ncbi:MAG TPA: CBS domain-containing protein [Gaiellales bacterium]|nr:CBS domain-containing protein [Gaiellales bacterium]
MATTTTAEILHLSMVAGGELRDAGGGRVGKVNDVIVRLDSDYPPVSGVLATVAGRRVFVPAASLASIEHGLVSLSQSKLDLQPFERRHDEVLLKRDVLDRQLINIDGARLVRANEIELARVEGWYRVVGVDVSLRGLARRVLPRRVAGTIHPGTFLDWAGVEPFTGHVPTVRLRVPHPKLARLHPAQLADLVEAASHGEGAEILRAVGGDGELEADVYEELDPHHQVEFLAQRPDDEVAAMMARMEPDDAVDLLGELDDERRERIVELLPALLRRRVRALAGYDPATAGGLMSPDFICLYSTVTREEALDRVRRSQAAPETLTWIYLMNQDRRLRSAMALADVVRSEPQAVLGDVALFMPPVLRPDADLEEIARVMTDYDLMVVPVVNDREMMLGVVTVDDVLEMVLPRGWRRRFDLLGGE